MEVNGFEECIKLLENTLISPTFLMYLHAEEYKDWLLKNLDGGGLGDAYSAHKLQLQLLMKHRGYGSSWVLKSPAHALCLESILKIYPDAILINTMRAPHESVASFCSLTRTIRSGMMTKPDLAQIGEFALQFFEISQTVLNNLRPEKSDQIIDVSYQSLIENPVNILEKILKRTGLSSELTCKEVVEAVRKEDSDSHKEKHHYDLETYQLQHAKSLSSFAQFEDYLREVELAGGVI